MHLDYLVIGAGAAGIFSAIIAKEKHPDLRVAIIEKNAVSLSKVLISGGGRCNVTHSCFDVRELIRNYPRGGKELIGPFHRFQPQDMVQWLAERGVKTKTESDGRIFPVTDKSQTIIQCLHAECQKNEIPIAYRTVVTKIEKVREEGFLIHLEKGGPLLTRRLLLATGSSLQGYLWAQEFGHTIQKPVPSLFTFNIPNFALAELSGVSVPKAHLYIPGTPWSQTAPLLITHFGFSGPAAIKLSAWAARYMNEKEYKTPIAVNWLPDLTLEEILKKILEEKERHSQKKVANETLFYLPKSLWKTLVGHEKTYQEVSNKELRALAERLQRDLYQVSGKTTHKEEFVTCGGVTLREIDFKRMESRLCPHLFFAGEILDIDGVTGGFNFQNAWTTGYIAGVSAGD